MENDSYLFFKSDMFTFDELETIYFVGSVKLNLILVLFNQKGKKKVIKSRIIGKRFTKFP